MEIIEIKMTSMGNHDGSLRDVPGIVFLSIFVKGGKTGSVIEIVHYG
jgi:hypothetical protein